MSLAEDLSFDLAQLIVSKLTAQLQRAYEHRGKQYPHGIVARAGAHNQYVLEDAGRPNTGSLGGFYITGRGQLYYFGEVGATYEMAQLDDFVDYVVCAAGLLYLRHYAFDRQPSLHRD
jgi:hypothetical protein